MNKIPRRVKRLAAHQMVANTAMEMAKASYENLMSADNEVYQAFRKKNGYAILGPLSKKAQKHLESEFVRLYWASHIPAARATLAAMLTGPYDEACKETIHAALVLDSTLQLGRGKPGGMLN